MRKRISALLLTMAMLLSLIVITPVMTITVVADTFSASDASPTITTAADLKAFRDAVNGGNTFEGKVIRLMADVDISDAYWTTIGKNGYAFCGSFDGQGHTITGMKQSLHMTGDGGLFGFVQVPTTGGTIYIRNLRLTRKSTETIYSSNGGYSAGTVVSIVAPRSGQVGTIEISNVYSSVVFDSSGQLMSAVGGILGTISGTTSQRDDNTSYASGTNITVNIDSCQYAGQLGSPSAGSTWYGGIMGCSNFVRCNRTVNITNCVVTGVIHIWGKSNLSTYDDNGGILGYIKGNGGASGCKVSVNLANNVFAGEMLWREDSGQTGGTADQGYILGEITSGYLGTVTMNNNYYCITTPQGGLEVTAGIGAGASLATTDTARCTEKSLAEIKALTSGFSDNSKWNFGTSSDVPVPVSISNLATYGSYSNTFASSYDINNTDDMLQFASTVDNDINTFEGKTVNLNADLDMTGTGFAGIGESGVHAFSGNFNGNGHTVNITQTLSDPDGNGCFIAFVRVPENGSVTIQNVHTIGTVTCNSTKDGRGYIGGLIDGVDAGKTGSGGTLNVTNCWSSVVFNLNNYKWIGVGGFIGFLRHESGVKPITINMDSCLWDGALNCNVIIDCCGGFVGYSGINKRCPGRTVNLNITNSVSAGTIKLSSANSDDSGLVAGYLKGNENATVAEKLTATMTNVVVTGRITSSVNITSGKWIGLMSTSGVTEVTLNKFYYQSFGIPGKGTVSVDPGNGTLNQTSVTVKDHEAMYSMTGSDFTDASKWAFSTNNYPCPKGIKDTFGIPESMKIYNLISSASDLNALATAVNSGTTYEGKNFLVTSDITVADWTSIGITDSKPFMGNFDGQGHTITITQSLSNPDGVGGLFSFVRTPASGTVTIKNVTVAGTITASNSASNKGYFSALVSCVDGNTFGDGGTINIRNCRVTARINLSGTESWSGIGGLVGFTRHADGLKPLTLNIDSCVWDGAINAANGIYKSGGFVGFTGQNKASRPLTINITNSVAAGTIMLNLNWNLDVGILLGYMEGSYSADANAKVTVNLSNVISCGKTTNSQNYGEGCKIGHIGWVDGTTEINATNVYYYEFDRKNLARSPFLASGSVNSSTNLEGMTYGGLASLTGSDFSDASKWSFKAASRPNYYIPCPTSLANPSAWLSELSKSVSISVYTGLRPVDGETNDGIRFTATFDAGIFCSNAGAKDANFGILLISKANYDKADDTATVTGLKAAGGRAVKAVKYMDMDGYYKVSVVVHNITKPSNQVVAVAYIGDTLVSDTVTVSYSSLS